jgi:DNA-binding response OmpR family regulator
MHILLIEDDFRLRRALARALRNYGYAVTTAADGECGFAAFRTERPDIVITDIIMPRREGIETIRAMRKERPETKIIAISGNIAPDGFDVLAVARKLGADEVLAKPFGTERLLTMIQSLTREADRNLVA